MKQARFRLLLFEAPQIEHLVLKEAMRQAPQCVDRVALFDSVLRGPFNGVRVVGATDDKAEAEQAQLVLEGLNMVVVQSETTSAWKEFVEQFKQGMRRNPKPARSGFFHRSKLPQDEMDLRPAEAPIAPAPQPLQITPPRKEDGYPERFFIYLPESRLINPDLIADAVLRAPRMIDKDALRDAPQRPVDDPVLVGRGDDAKEIDHAVRRMQEMGLPVVLFDRGSGWQQFADSLKEWWHRRREPKAPIVAAELLPELGGAAVAGPADPNSLSERVVARESVKRRRQRSKVALAQIGGAAVVLALVGALFAFRGSLARLWVRTEGGGTPVLVRGAPAGGASSDTGKPLPAATPPEAQAVQLRPTAPAAATPLFADGGPPVASSTPQGPAVSQPATAAEPAAAAEPAPATSAQPAPVQAPAHPYRTLLEDLRKLNQPAPMGAHPFQTLRARLRSSPPAAGPKQPEATALYAQALAARFAQCASAEGLELEGTDRRLLSAAAPGLSDRMAIATSKGLCPALERDFNACAALAPLLPCDRMATQLGALISQSELPDDAAWERAFALALGRRLLRCQAIEGGAEQDREQAFPYANRVAAALAAVSRTRDCHPDEARLASCTAALHKMECGQLALSLGVDERTTGEAVAVACGGFLICAR